MKHSFHLSPLFMALAATIPAYALAEESSKDGFIEGSSLNVHARNYYMNHDIRSPHSDDSKEWGQGFVGKFESGFTRGTVGFGLDVNAMLGLKLDASGGNNSSGILPLDHEGKTGSSLSSAGATFKARAFDTELRAGDLFLSNPVIAGGESRMLPQTFRGASLTNTSLDGWMFEGGQASFTKLYNQSGMSRMTTSYGDLDGQNSKHLTWAGASWSGLPNLTSNLYAAQLKDIWNQYYFDLDYTYDLSESISLNPGLHYYYTRDSGKALLGDINNNAFSLHLGMSIAEHTVTAVMQQINGNTPFDYINQGDSIFLDNSQQYSDFNGPNERSWKLQYQYDFAGLGLAGLTSSLSYSHGELDLTKANPNSIGYGHWYNPQGKNASHWERDMDLKYVIQDGKAKNLGVTLRWATHRGNTAYQTVDNNVDEYRVIINYPLNVF